MDATRSFSEQALVLELPDFRLRIKGASDSIDVLADLFSLPLIDELSMADPRLRLRCIVGPGAGTDWPPTIGPNWQVKTSEHILCTSSVLVDREALLVLPDTSVFAPRFGETFVLSKEPQLVRDLQRHFEECWNTGQSATSLIYEDFISSSIPRVANGIILASRECWDNVTVRLLRHPEQLFSISPRDFEELVAELLTRQGMQVQLTQPSRDGGRDILAWAETAVGNHLYLVECKRYKPDNPVDVSMVRALYGVVSAENATAGCLVTTSHFTRDAK